MHDRGESTIVEAHLTAGRCAGDSKRVNRALIDHEVKRRLIGHGTVHVSLRLLARFIALVDRIAAKNRQSRTSVLLQVFMLGLHEYALLYKLASVPAGEHDSNDALIGEHTPETVPASEHKSESSNGSTPPKPTGDSPVRE